MLSPTPPTPAAAFLAGGGETGARIAAQDWAATPLGPIDRWPASLLHTTATLLRSRVPMVLLWGADGVMLYNDAYSVFAGGRHPQLLGSKVREGWPEVADFNDHVMHVGLGGGTLAYRDQELTLLRHGVPEPVWMNLDYSPVLDDAGRPAGVLAIVVETSERVRSERHRLAAEGALRASEARLSLSAESLWLATEAAEVGIWDLDLATDALTWSARTKAAFGISPDAPCSMADFYACLHPDDREATTAAFASAIDAGRRTPYDVEYRTIGKEDGVLRHVAARGKALFDGDGRCVRAIGTAIDVSARKEVERHRLALVSLGARIRDLDDPDELSQAAAELLGRTLAVSRVGYGTLDASAESVAIAGCWNAPGTLTLAGVLPLGQLGTCFGDLEAGRAVVLVDARARATAAALEALGVGSALYLPIVEAGRPVALLLLHHRTPRAWSDDELGFIREVAERSRAAIARRQAEHELRALNTSLERQVAERTAELERVWTQSRDLAVVVDAGGIFRAVNPAWTRILGHATRDVVGRSFIDFVWPEDVARTQDGLDDANATRELHDFENRYIHRDGTPRWISWRTATEGGPVYAYGRDVTAEKEQAAALLAAQEALRQSQKMEAVGQLTGGIAHDFNNMLAVIIGSLDLLGRRPLVRDDPRARRYLDAARDGARRAATLTQRLLAFSRQQPLKPEAIDAGRLVTGMSELLGGSLRSDIRLEMVLTGGAWRTYADPNQLENVLLNLVVNARDAMPEGGKLTIETQNAHLDERYAAENLGVAAGQYVLIAVTDTGCGMSKEVIAKAFDPFFTTKEVGKGTGLGLSQVYGFVKQSGGHVKIYSEPGEGTTVKVYLPRLAGAAADRASEPPAEQGPFGEHQDVVLVVEDQAAVRQVSVDALTELGYRVLEADGAAAALGLLDAHPEIALLFTDIVMPDVNGARLAEEARRRRPGLKVLYTTGYTRNAVVHNGVLDANVDLISKPFTLDELALRVRQVLEAPPGGGEGG